MYLSEWNSSPKNHIEKLEIGASVSSGFGSCFRLREKQKLFLHIPLFALVSTSYFEKLFYKLGHTLPNYNFLFPKLVIVFIFMGVLLLFLFDKTLFC